ncbi:MAG: hypothetical protein EBY05_01740, partial [Actinobacteria bacterium]|nr:hypothetical protein [Actinomycetota bacterium]
GLLPSATPYIPLSCLQVVKFPASSNFALMKWLSGIQASKNGEPGKICAYFWAASWWEVVIVR